jgi:hypothetical protein
MQPERVLEPLMARYRCPNGTTSAGDKTMAEGASRVYWGTLKGPLEGPPLLAFSTGYTDSKETFRAFGGVFGGKMLFGTGHR